MPADDLKKLAKVFDTPEDLILLMKSHFVKRGAEGAIALAYAHGEEADWEKVSSSRGRPLLELRSFFKKAKKYAPGIVSIVSPSAASTTSSTPVSLTPMTSASMPPHGRRQLTRVNSTNVLDEGLSIGEIGRRMNSKVKLVKQGVYRK
jgi:hypothetical protein